MEDKAHEVDGRLLVTYYQLEFGLFEKGHFIVQDVETPLFGGIVEHARVVYSGDTETYWRGKSRYGTAKHQEYHAIYDAENNEWIEFPDEHQTAHMEKVYPQTVTATIFKP